MRKTWAIRSFFIGYLSSGCFARPKADTLDMVSLREKVERGDMQQGVALLCQAFAVAGQRGGVAGNVVKIRVRIPARLPAPLPARRTGPAGWRLDPTARRER